MHTVTVDKITVVGGARTTRVKRDGEVIATHGLGAVGEPLAPTSANAPKDGASSYRTTFATWRSSTSIPTGPSCRTAASE